MLPQSITNSLEINEKAENLSKETDVIKKKKKKRTKWKEYNYRNKKTYQMGSGRVEMIVFELQDIQQSSPHLKKREKRWMKVIRPIAIINSTSLGF